MRRDRRDTSGRRQAPSGQSRDRADGADSPRRQTLKSQAGRIVALVFLSVLVPILAYAQASIAGVAKDASGAVIPGVTVEVASPVLIEKVRTAVTDGAGAYRITDLLPGTYSVTFTLQGFNTFRRDGI